MYHARIDTHIIFATIMVKKVNVQHIHRMDGKIAPSASMSAMRCSDGVRVNSIKIIEGTVGAGDHHGLHRHPSLLIHGIPRSGYMYVLYRLSIPSF